MFSLSSVLKRNMMAGLHTTRTKNVDDYLGVAIPPCGDFATVEGTSSQSPWLQDIPYQSSSLSLNLEIHHFMRYMSPSPIETAVRKDVVRRFTDLIETLDTNITVLPVGSYVTGLSLPTSDIDMVLSPRTTGLSYQTTTTVQSIYPKILASGFASEITTVFNASVPVMKITDRLTGIEIDLSGARDQAMKATDAVLKWLKKDSEIIKMLFFVVKTFLMVRRCGTTYTGGINSYVLVWMVVAWVNLEWPKIRRSKIHIPGPQRLTMNSEESLSSMFDVLSLHSACTSSRASKSPSANSGSTVLGTSNTVDSEYEEALKGFLSFYSGQFSYRTDSIVIEPTPGYKPKPYAYSRYYPIQRFLLSIIDPADPSVDMGSKAYGINHIKASFREAYSTIADHPLTAVNKGLGGPLSVMLGGDFTRFVEKRAFMTRCR